MRKVAEHVIPYYNSFWQELSSYLEGRVVRVTGVFKRGEKKYVILARTSIDYYIYVTQINQEIHLTAYVSSHSYKVS